MYSHTYHKHKVQFGHKNDETPWFWWFWTIFAIFDMTSIGYDVTVTTYTDIDTYLVSMVKGDP